VAFCPIFVGVAFCPIFPEMTFFRDPLKNR